LIEPSGLCYEYKAWSIGKHRQAAKTEIEKLKLDELTIDQLVKETVRILITIRDEAKEKNVRIEMGWVGKNTNGRHEVGFLFA
jgi:20S proteasome subunit alpha 7